jgi:plastocyanin
MRTRIRPAVRAVPVVLAVAAVGLVGTPAARAALAPAHTGSSISAAHHSTAVAVPSKNMIVKHAFTPLTMSVPVGTTVTWTNQDDVPHTVTTTKAPVTFDSGVFDKGKSFSYTFAKPGTYEYYCAVHPDMRATVVVTGAAAPAGKKVVTSAPTPPEKKPGAPDASKDGMGSMTPPGKGDNGAASPAGTDDGWTPASDPVSGTSDPFMKHLQAAHFNRSAAGQVHDIADFDDWMKSHQYLFRQMLDYEIGRQSSLGQAPVIGTFLQHMDVAHWNRSPAGQASDIADLDSWLKSHEALFRMMLDPAVGKSGPAYTAPVTGPFMQHMDAAHWNRSPGQQLEDIADFQNWAAAHAALIQAMIASGGGGSSGR